MNNLDSVSGYSFVRNEVIRPVSKIKPWFPFSLVKRIDSWRRRCPDLSAATVDLGDGLLPGGLGGGETGVGQALHDIPCLAALLVLGHFAGGQVVRLIIPENICFKY